MFRRLVSGELCILRWRHSQSSKCLRLLSCDSVIGPDRGQDLSREERTVPTELVRLVHTNTRIGPADDTFVSSRAGKQKRVCKVILDRFDQQYGQELGPLWPSARAVLLNPACWQYGVMLNRFAAVSEVKQRLQGQGFVSLLPHTDLPLNSSPTQPSSIPHPGPPPPSLQCFIHPSPVRYPSPPHRQGQLKPYYLMNAASLLPVLALGVEEGDRVLDLCSAPGGKALAILQTADPARLCCNEMDPHRRDWLAKTLESFIPQWLSSTVTVSNQDGRIFGQSEAGMYDKVLLDAPCSNDRSWLFSGPGGEQHGAVRLRERARLPTLQTQLLSLITSSLITSCLITSCLITSCLITSCLITSCLITSSLITSCLITSSLITSSLITSCLITSCLITSCLITSCLITSCLITSCMFPRSALAALRPGGVAVYSTCTMSRSENQEVVEAVLNSCPGVELQDLEEELALPLQEHFTFTPLGHTPSLGLLVVPQQGQTWGPMFLSRIKRIH